MHFSLRLKTMIGVALIQAMLLLILVAMTFDYLRTTNYDAIEKRAQTSAILFAATVQEAVLASDLSSVQAMTGHLVNDPDIKYVRVFGPDKVLFASAGHEQALARPFSKDSDASLVEDGIFDSAADIRVAGSVFGRVEIGLDLSAINSTLSQALSRSSMIALGEMGLVALFSFILGSFLTRQLRTLTEAAGLVARGNLSFKVPVTGHDEVSKVAEAFNAMTEELDRTNQRRDEYEQALQQLNLTLEDRVAQRTRELQEKNQQLAESHQYLSQAQSKLLHSEKMASLGVLAAGVAHEINNPVSFIMSNLTTLEQYCKCYQNLLDAYAELGSITDPEEARVQRLKIEAMASDYDLNFINDDLPALLKDAIDGTRRVSDIVRGLRDFSHSGADDDWVVTDLNATLTSVLKVIHNELKYHCEVKQSLDQLPAIKCKEGQIRQVLLNLLLNAGQAIEGQGEINVTSRFTDGWIEIKICDTGCGIPSGDLGKIFDPFYTTKPVGKGTGLGLAVSYGIAKDHGGEIKVQSTVGKGSCFSLRLPAGSEAQAHHYFSVGETDEIH
ncbi:ATP-binding protein [Neptuniibacter sp. CAU 1671]|uniref:sensor histidine kinase n=1 Tax=Neptuniibacter sp. CAU 1671 TaxID=3032593 RepID=UPI0023DA2317|nr:ATP-binding protein [Neptuniibacter sp. CAU 1671]MDF2181136.1 ATP-binding protein [Neptuniibacter sp. CAU 1671]